MLTRQFKPMEMEFHYNVNGCFRDPMADIDLAKRANDAGFQGIWIADHFMPWLDHRDYTHHVFPWFGALMNEIPNVPVGTAVTCPMIRYRPPLLAQAIATLDHMYPGRFNLGIGVGEAVNECHFINNWPNWQTRAEMMIESIEVMHRLWNEDGYISFDGEHFQFDSIKIFTQPKAEIPFHWAAWGPKSAEFAGSFADHLYTVAEPDHIENVLVPHFETGLEKANRDIQGVDITTELEVNIGEPEHLASEIRERGEQVPALSELDTSDPRDIQEAANELVENMTTTDIIEDHNITEDPEEIIPIIERFKEAGVSRLIVNSYAGDPYQTIDAFEEVILPHFKD